MKISKHISLLILAAFFNAATQAALPDEIQVYDGEINAPGEFGLELHVNTSLVGVSTPSFDRERLSDKGVRITPEFSYGLSKTVELGFYVPTIYTQEYGYEVAGYKPRLKWMPIQADESQPWSLGVNFEYANLRYGMEDSQERFESRFIVGWQGKDWNFAFNPIFSTNLSPGFSRTPELSTFARALYKTKGELLNGIGLEYYQSWGPYDSFVPNTEQPKQMFVVAELSSQTGFFKYFDLHAGIGKGWNTADPLVFKMILTPKFK